MASKLLHAARSVVLSAALASCGGGGDGSGSPAPTGSGGAGSGGIPVPPLMALNAANAQDVAGGATLAGLETSSLGALLDGANAAAMRTTAPALPRTHVLTRFIKQQVDQMIRTQTAPGVRVAATLAPPTCNTGSATVVDNGRGSVTETFSACSPEAGLSLDGTVTISDMSVDPGVSFSGLAAINLVLKQTGSPDMTFMGGGFTVLETINVNVVTFTLSGPSVSITTGTVTETLRNFTLTASFDGTAETDEVTFNYSSTTMTGSVNVSTVTACVTNQSMNFPNTGVLGLAGSGGSQIRVTINGDESLATPQVTIDLDANGDGTFETTLNKNWADL